MDEVLVWRGSDCDIVSSCPNDDGKWNGYKAGDEEDCLFCDHIGCIAKAEWMTKEKLVQIGRI